MISMILQIHIGIGRYVNMITCLKGCQPGLKKWWCNGAECGGAEKHDSDF